MINIFKGEQMKNNPLFFSANYEKEMDMVNNCLMMYARYEATLPIVHSEGDSS